MVVLAVWARADVIFPYIHGPVESYNHGAPWMY
jgi:hypothetical protein